MVGDGVRDRKVSRKIDVCLAGYKSSHGPSSFLGHERRRAGGVRNERVVCDLGLEEGDDERVTHRGRKELNGDKLDSDDLGGECVLFVMGGLYAGWYIGL
ncbi:unnamed protein product [Dovyalis caffra]|uniref:Uncharacterized protein n=1 Tax=Dovyalis caffra TaxID=77055 RepID=A0AAV1QN56_9ROSI|nr:unnamed protein product [Dovyalis caffra]